MKVEYTNVPEFAETLWVEVNLSERDKQEIECVRECFDLHKSILSVTIGPNSKVDCFDNDGNDVEIWSQEIRVFKEGFILRVSEKYSQEIIEIEIEDFI